MFIGSLAEIAFDEPSASRSFDVIDFVFRQLRHPWLGSTPAGVGQRLLRVRPMP